MARELIAELVINHEPISPVNQYKARAIRKGRTHMAMMYIDKRFLDYKTSVETIARDYAAEHDITPTDSMVEVKADFYFGTRRRKDLPNAGKLEFDALNGIIWEDDSQIVKLSTEKRYDKENPRTEIKVYKIESRYWPVN